jgi:hypothetical protein
MFGSSALVVLSNKVVQASHGLVKHGKASQMTFLTVEKQTALVTLGHGLRTKSPELLSTESAEEPILRMASVLWINTIAEHDTCG